MPTHISRRLSKHACTCTTPPAASTRARHHRTTAAPHARCCPTANPRMKRGSHSRSSCGAARTRARHGKVTREAQTRSAGRRRARHVRALGRPRLNVRQIHAVLLECVEDVGELPDVVRHGEHGRRQTLFNDARAADQLQVAHVEPRRDPPRKRRRAVGAARHTYFWNVRNHAAQAQHRHGAQRR